MTQPNTRSRREVIVLLLVLATLCGVLELGRRQGPLPEYDIALVPQLRVGTWTSFLFVDGALPQPRGRMYAFGPVRLFRHRSGDEDWKM